MKMDDMYTRKKGIIYKNQYHIIWCSKYRRKVLVDGIAERLKEILCEAAAEKTSRSRPSRSCPITSMSSSSSIREWQSIL